jgi:hypothetical protein
MHIRAPGQRGHTVDPLAQPLPPLVFKQTVLDFGQRQDRWHGQILLRNGTSVHTQFTIYLPIGLHIPLPVL